jgi:hypothetical protein
VSEYRPVPWSKARRYTRRAVFIRRGSDGVYLRVQSITPKHPNLLVRLADGREVFVDKSRVFYARHAG